MLAAGSKNAIDALANKKALDTARGKLSKAVNEAEEIAGLVAGARPRDGVAFAGEI